MANANKVRVVAVVAMAENRVIGRDGGLPWHLSGDLQYFKRVTMGKPMVMGRKTYQSIGRPLPGRLTIVITRDQAYAPVGASGDGPVSVSGDDPVSVSGDGPGGVLVVHTLDAAVIAARERAEDDGVDEIMVVGGGQVYADALPMTDRVHLTEVHASVDGDTVFPELPGDEWREVSREDHAGIKGGEPAYSFVILERITEQTGE